MATSSFDHTVVKETTRLHRDAILSRPGVTGIFTGKKTTGGVTTDTTAVVVCVAHKRDVAIEDRIPETLDGVPTDVIQERFVAAVDSSRYDTLIGGIEVSVTPETDIGFAAGTLGLVVTDASTGDPMALSCWHVLYGTGAGNAGDIMVQPGYAGGDPSPNRIGTTTRFALSDTVDGAVGKLEGFRSLSGSVAEIGAITATGPASVSMSVSKRGRTTGLTTGTVAATDFSGIVAYGAPTGDHTFTNIIRFTGDPGMVLGGDSGSMLISGSTVVGLVIAQSTEDGSVALASPIADVFSELGIILYVPPVGLLLTGSSVKGHADILDVNEDLVISGVPADWSIWGTFSLLDDTSAFLIGIGDPATPAEYPNFYVRFPGVGASGAGNSLALHADSDSGSGGTVSFRTHAPITFSLSWVAATKTLSCQAGQSGSPPASGSIVLTGSPSLTLPYTAVIAATRTGSGDAVVVTSLRAGRDCGVDGGGGGGGADCALTIDTGDWTDNGFNGGVGPIVTTNQIEINGSDSPVYPIAWEQDFPVPLDQDWILSFDVHPIGGVLVDHPDEVEWQAGVGNHGDWSNYAVYCFATLDKLYNYNHGNDDAGTVLPIGLDFANDFSVAMSFLHLSGDLMVTVTQDATINTSTVSDGGLNDRDDPFFVQFVATNGIVQISNLCLSTGEVLAANWTSLIGSWSFPGDVEAHNSETDDADAYATGHVFDGTERCRFSGHCDLGASDEVLLSWILDDTEGAATGVFAGIQAIVGASPSLYVYTWDGFQEDLGTDLSGLTAGFDFSLDWIPRINAFSFLLIDSDTSAILASGTYILGSWPGDKTLHIEHGSAVVCSFDLTGLSVTVGG